MPVDESGHEPRAIEIELGPPGADKIVLLLADSDDPAGRDQHMAKPELFGREDSGVGKKLQQWTVRAKKRGDSLHYEIIAK